MPSAKLEEYYERMGFSKDKKALQRLTANNAQQLTPRDIIHDPVSLEFLGLPSQDVVTETKLENTILNHLQAVLMEMGRRFCFEARQKRILIDQDYFKADLIFYHRILKCHVIIDLKIDRFRHEYASQLNLYMNYYKHEVMQADDNPPIGLLLCTDYGETTVQYATEGLSQNLFVSKYRLQLPSEEEMRQYLLESATEADWEDYLMSGSKNIQKISNIMPLVDDLRQIINQTRSRVAVNVNAELTLMYWHIGERINREVLGNERAEYGKQIVATLSQQLQSDFGS